MAAPCSSTAAAMVEEISDSFSIVLEISLIAPTDSSRRGLDAGDLLADLARRFRGLFGQSLHFRSDHRKAAAGLAGARRLDGGVQRQQVGLAGDGVDQFDHVADTAGGLRQFADPVVGGTSLADGVTRHPRRFLHLAADLGDRRRQLFGCGCHRLYIGRGLFGRRGHRGGELSRAIGGRQQRAGRGFELRRGRGYGLHDLADRTFKLRGELDHVGLALPGEDLVLIGLGFRFVAGLLFGVLANRR